MVQLTMKNLAVWKKFNCYLNKCPLILKYIHLKHDKTQTRHQNYDYIKNRITKAIEKNHIILKGRKNP